jgi:intein/homing endonuclease
VLIRKKSISKYQVNHNIFQEETERSFYLAGFIAADGCIRISKTNKTRDYINHRLQISLSRNDKEHLTLIRDLLESTNPIRDYLIENSKKNPKWNDVWESKLLITSKQMVDDLKKFNIVPRKSLIYTFPAWLKKHPLRHHFMRGYFDGDGSFFINSELSYDRLCCSIRGTEKFLKVYRRLLELECGKGGNLDTSDRAAQLRFKGKLSLKIRDYLYRDATIYLPRKHNISNSVGEDK